ncbi:MAG: hypothetical protein E7463_00630 [Ruminococcaceae bacterium]|nr:hypothetical protein [Oscillospiraceae bacterium]
MKAGFARLDITPPFGTRIVGYYSERIADGILDPLQVNAVAFSDGEHTAVAVSMDVLELLQVTTDIIRRRAAGKNGIPMEAIFLSCTHTHTGPQIDEGMLFKTNPSYNEYFFDRVSDVIALAIDDMCEASVEIARGTVRDVAFIRRFLMKDGTVKMNPGPDPDVVRPVGTADETVQLVKIVREDAADIAIVNFQVHPDVIGGTKFSADYPGFVRRILESALADEKDGKGVHAVYFNGAQGDTNHINRMGSLTKGYAHSRHMGRAIAGGVLAVYSQTVPVASDRVFFRQVSALVPPNRGTAEEVKKAHEYARIHAESGAEAAAKACPGIVSLPHAQRIIWVENAPEFLDLHVTCVGFGEVAFVGLPGEPFTEIGRAIKEGSPFAMTIPCCNTNGSEGYFPTRDTFDSGSYETISSRFKSGVAEKLIETGVSLTKELKAR